LKKSEGRAEAVGAPIVEGKEGGGGKKKKGGKQDEMDSRAHATTSATNA